MIVHHLWEYMCMEAMLNFHYSLVIEYIINIEGVQQLQGQIMWNFNKNVNFVGNVFHNSIFKVVLM